MLGFSCVFLLAVTSGVSTTSDHGAVRYLTRGLSQESYAQSYLKGPGLLSPHRGGDRNGAAFPRFEALFFLLS